MHCLLHAHRLGLWCFPNKLGMENTGKNGLKSENCYWFLIFFVFIFDFIFVFFIFFIFFIVFIFFFFICRVLWCSSWVGMVMVESGEHDRRGSIRLENLSGVQRLVGAGHEAQGTERKVQRHIEGRVG